MRTRAIGRPTGYLVSRIARPKRCFHAQRHFIPHHLGLKGLFAKFHEQNVDYLVLRWFEELPEREPNGDIDLLVADEDQQRVLAILNSGPAVRPCDLYTPTNLPETSYQAVSYYPPEVARRMLKNARCTGAIAGCRASRIISIASPIMPSTIKAGSPTCRDRRITGRRNARRATSSRFCPTWPRRWGSTSKSASKAFIRICRSGAGRRRPIGSPGWRRRRRTIAGWRNWLPPMAIFPRWIADSPFS